MFPLTWLIKHDHCYYHCTCMYAKISVVRVRLDTVRTYAHPRPYDSL